MSARATRRPGRERVETSQFTNKTANSGGAIDADVANVVILAALFSNNVATECGEVRGNVGGAFGAISVAQPLTLIGVLFGTGLDANVPSDVWTGSSGFSAGGLFSGTCALNQGCVP